MDEETLARLAASIRTSGVMQPVAVRPGSETGRWELIAGERRWRAATLAGLTEIPALVAEIDDQEAAEWAIVENVQREDLNPVDRALAYCRLVVDFDMTHGEIADRAGVDRSTVANLIRLTELEQELLDLLAAGHLQVGHAKVLLSMPRGIRRVTLGKTAAAINMSVRQLEDEVEKAMSQEGPTTVGGLSAGVVEPKKEPKASGAHNALERQLADHLGTKVRIRHQQRTGRGKVTIEYYDLEHFDALMSMLGFRYDS